MFPKRRFNSIIAAFQRIQYVLFDLSILCAGQSDSNDCYKMHIGFLFSAFYGICRIGMCIYIYSWTNLQWSLNVLKPLPSQTHNLNDCPFHKICTRVVYIRSVPFSSGKHWKRATHAFKLIKYSASKWPVVNRARLVHRSFVRFVSKIARKMSRQHVRSMCNVHALCDLRRLFPKPIVHILLRKTNKVTLFRIKESNILPLITNTYFRYFIRLKWLGLVE